MAGGVSRTQAELTLQSCECRATREAQRATWDRLHLLAVLEQVQDYPGGPARIAEGRGGGPHCMGDPRGVQAAFPRGLRHGRKQGLLTGLRGAVAAHARQD